jgi:hypothetical protein
MYTLILTGNITMQKKVEDLLARLLAFAFFIYMAWSLPEGMKDHYTWVQILPGQLLVVALGGIGSLLGPQGLISLIFPKRN